MRISATYNIGKLLRYGFFKSPLNYRQKTSSSSFPHAIGQYSRAMATHSGHNLNRLASEKSPYLLQHAENPVDWYPWGNEAIQKAKDEDKLIFVSVGYSTCHWCHVMEKESFMNEEVAKIMNHYFVNIKVDREERPDIDQIYMNFLVKTNGGGGWPMSIWITSDLAPIMAGTYFPPDDQWGRPGFKRILMNVADKWKENKQQLINSGQSILKRLIQSEELGSPMKQDSSEVQKKFDQSIEVFKRITDDIWGGFNQNTKFPEVSKLNFLMHMHSIRPTSYIYDFVTNTLKKMAQGGIHDHVFGGFARYSVDRKWHVPHFEKMLYDQGQMMTAYSNAFKATGNEFYLDVADKIVQYIRKDLQHPEGGFFSGEDADSYTNFGDADKIEGAFYAWSWHEINALFEKNSAKFTVENAFDIYCHYYSISKLGNVEPSSDPHGHLNEKNILIVFTTLQETADKFKIDMNTVTMVLHRGNSILYEARCQRPRPHLDTKIITSWNGLVLSGLSQLACLPEAPNKKLYLEMASKLIDFIKKYLYKEKTRTLLRSCYGQGTETETIMVLDNPVNGFLDDYAFLIKGLLDYYLATLDPHILMFAKTLQNTQDRLFWDSKEFGYFFSEENAANVVMRMKDAHDGAEPSGNSVSAINLLLLSTYFENGEYEKKAVELFSYFGNVEPFGFALPEMFSGLLLQEHGVPTLITVGHNDDAMKFINIARNFYIPGITIVNRRDDDDTSEIRPSSKQYTTINDKATAYLCHNQTCELPLTNEEELKDKLSAKYFFK